MLVYFFILIFFFPPHHYFLFFPFDSHKLIKFIYLKGLYDAVKGVGMELCPALGIAIPVGKDSMSMKTKWVEDGLNFLRFTKKKKIKNSSFLFLYLSNRKRKFCNCSNILNCFSFWNCSRCSKNFNTSNNYKWW